MLSSVRCDTVCRNGKVGVVNGVVMPAISIQTMPVARADDGLVGQAVDGAEARAEVVLLERPHRLRPGILELPRLQVEDRRLAVDLGRREIQRVAQARIDRQAIGHLPVVLDEVLLKVRALLNLRLLQVDGRRSAPVRAGSSRARCRCSRRPGRSLPTVLKANDPVGDGGWITLSRSHRQSSPIFMVWRPFSQVSESAISRDAGAEVRRRVRRRAELLVAVRCERSAACWETAQSTGCREC